MTAEQLEELLGKVTQGEWRVSERGTNTVKGGLGERIAYPDPADLTESEIAANATIIAAAPALARRVIAAERVISAIALAEFDYEKWQAEDAEELDAALTAYREASK